jgi:hypothetical protein
MSRPLVDIAGQRFGKLTAIERTNVRNSNLQPLWMCKCDCGGTAYYTTGQLRQGGAKSCGCIRPSKERRKPLTIPPEFEYCMAASPPGKYTEGCEGLRELLCAKNGKCPFYKPKPK